MNAMNLPGFTAEQSLYNTRGQYHAARQETNSSQSMIVPAIPKCENCDYILDRCEKNGWLPRAVCNACLYGNCYHEPPAPDPFPNPFGSVSRF